MAVQHMLKDMSSLRISWIVIQHIDADIQFQFKNSYRFCFRRAFLNGVKSLFTLLSIFKFVC